MKFKLYKWQLGLVGIYNQIFNPPHFRDFRQILPGYGENDKNVIITPKWRWRIGLIKKYCNFYYNFEAFRIERGR